MKAETEALLQECRTALLRQSDERIAALLAWWFENLIGDDYLEEELDDLCLLLDYRVQSWGTPIAYATYTSWWEVEGYLEPSEGTFTCKDLPSLRQRLLDLPIKQFDQIVEMAYQARTALAEVMGGPSLPTGWEGLHEMAAWMELADPTSNDVEMKAVSPNRFESKDKQRRREQERANQASQQGYLVVTPDSSHVLTETFRNWCKKQKLPYISVEPLGRQLAVVRVLTKTANINAVMVRLEKQLPALAAPYLASAQAQNYAASLSWISKRQVALEGILATEAQFAAQEIVDLWATITAEEKQHEAVEAERRREALIPIWRRELTRWSAEGNPPELPPLAEEVVLPPEWGELLTREHLSAFLTYLSLPVTTRETKAILVQHIQEHLTTNPLARAQFLEIFKRELAVPPWELETLLPCTPTERKRWTDEERLPILDERSFRKASDYKSYPVFDRRIILTLPHSEIEQWRAEHQAQVKERRSIAAKAAAARRKDSSGV
jgi:hypothetical protein